MEYKIKIDHHFRTSICTGKVYSEGWFIWLVCSETSETKYLDQIVCHVINNIYNTSGDSHGYSWYMLPNRLINGWLHPTVCFKTKEETMDKALKFIIQELKYNNINYVENYGY